jgi:hypothetical protein
MPSGIIQLGAYGKEDMYITYQPEITFFKIVYKRHTYFSMELIDQYFTNSLNFNGNASTIIFNNADLITDLYLSISLPGIPALIDTATGVVDPKFAFRWVDKLGFNIIKLAQIEIGGKVIQRLTGEWINIWYELTNFDKNPASKQIQNQSRGIEILIGNLPKLTTYSNSKPSVTMTIPIPFWFTRSPGTALPLNAINFNEVKINIQLQPLSNLIIYGPTHYVTIVEPFVLFKRFEYIYQNNNTSIGIFYYFDSSTQKLYYNKLQGAFKQVSLTSTTDVYQTPILDIGKEFLNSSSNLIKNSAGYFCTPNISEVPTQFVYNPNYNVSQANLQVNYIFLENEERKFFYNNNHEYIIEQIQYLTKQQISSIYNNILLNFTNPVSEIIWTLQLNNNYNNKDYQNYTTSVGDTINIIPIKFCQLVFNGYEILSQRNAEYCRLVQLFESHSHTPVFSGVYLYSFCLKPEYIQPSGSYNMSKIEQAYLNLVLYPYVSTSNTAILKVYGRNFNVLQIINGIAEVLF